MKKKKTKLLLLLSLLPGIFIFSFFTMVVFFIASDWSSSQPIQLIATPDQAYEYQFLGSELGVPWDIVLLANAIHAKQEKLPDISSYNPIVTSLEFCILQEDYYELEPVPVEDNEDEKEEDLPDEGTDEEEEEEPEYIMEWVLKETFLYKGCDEILAYINLHRDSISFKDATSIVVAMNTKAEKKSNEKEKYEITLLANTDYNYVLHDLIGLDNEYVNGVLELYEAQYLAEIYGYMPLKEDFDEITVPSVPSNGITRMDLAKTAVSLINWPYLLGGKSPYTGSPVSALDCSGYVDWVYIQCFHKGVSAGGRVPAGIAVSGTAIQYYASEPISESELKIGDLGFIQLPANVKAGGYNHVGIYLGELNGRHVWIHCGGKSYGYSEKPNGRVGISVTSGTNSYDPISGSFFSPEMKSCNFKYFRRPKFEFADDDTDTEGGS